VTAANGCGRSPHACQRDPLSHSSDTSLQKPAATTRLPFSSQRRRDGSFTDYTAETKKLFEQAAKSAEKHLHPAHPLVLSLALERATFLIDCFPDYTSPIGSSSPCFQHDCFVIAASDPLLVDNHRVHPFVGARRCRFSKADSSLVTACS
jgi:hypothetical protein